MLGSKLNHVRGTPDVILQDQLVRDVPMDYHENAIYCKLYLGFAKMYSSKPVLYLHWFAYESMYVLNMGTMEDKMLK